MLRRLFIASACGILSMGMAGSAFAAEQSFSDVPSTHPAFQAIEYLKQKGTLSGYADGTFRPGNKVVRAETAKLIVASILNASELTATTSVYTDVPDDAWFLPYVEAARAKLKIIDGPPKATAFHPARPVKKAEFLKMFLASRGVDVASAYSEFVKPLASDVSSGDWFYPYVRYALSASMITVGADGTLGPGQELTRADIAQIIYFYEMYKQNRRTQSLLGGTENDLANVMRMMDARQTEQVEYASARAILMARGALASRPDEAIVKGAVKISEGFAFLALAYKAGVNGELDAVIALSKEAWNVAEKAKAFSPSLTTLAVQLQTIAKNMADEAREVAQ